MNKKRPHCFVDGYNLIHVWQEINTDDLAAGAVLMYKIFYQRSYHND